MRNKNEVCSEKVDNIYLEESPEKRLKMLEEAIEECWEIEKLQEQILLSFYNFEDFVSEELIRLISKVSEKAFDNLFPHILESLIEEIGKKKCTEVLDILEKLIDDTSENEIGLKIYFFSDFIANLSQGDLNKVVGRLRHWLTDSKKKEVILYSLKKILTIQNLSDDELKQIYDLLGEMAKLEGLNSAVITKSESNLRYKCGLLIERIIYKPARIDIGLAEKNFEKFKNIANFVGENFFDKVNKIESYIQHPLLILLSEELLEPEDYSLLKHIDNGLGYINLNEKGTRDMRNKFIKQPEGFQAVLSEIEIIGRLRKENYKVEISPEIEIEEDETIVGKNLDLRVEMDDEDLLIEVISPEMMRKLRYFGSALIKKNRLRDAILCEFTEKHKLDKMKLKKPILFIVDTSGSEIDYETAKSCLEGSLGVESIRYKNSNRVDCRLIRMEDSLHHINPRTDIIIGLIVYKRILGKDEDIHLKGRGFLNPYSNHPKKEELIEKVKLALLG